MFDPKLHHLYVSLVGFSLYRAPNTTYHSGNMAEVAQFHSFIICIPRAHALNDYAICPYETCIL
jgi:hypothetical protein